MIRELIKISNLLDKEGLTKEADYLDAIIRKVLASDAVNAELPLPADEKLRADDHYRKSMGNHYRKSMGDLECRWCDHREPLWNVGTQGGGMSSPWTRMLRHAEEEHAAELTEAMDGVINTWPSSSVIADPTVGLGFNPDDPQNINRPGSHKEHSHWSRRPEDWEAPGEDDSEEFGEMIGLDFPIRY